MSTRAALYARLGIARRALAAQGWDEDRYRAHLAAHGADLHRGRPSASTMSGPQIEAALAPLETLTGRAVAEGSILGRCNRQRRPQWSKVIALWCALADAGVVRSRGESAMLAWAGRYIRAARIEWASAPDLARCIEALKDWAARTGVALDG